MVNSLTICTKSYLCAGNQEWFLRFPVSYIGYGTQSNMVIRDSWTPGTIAEIHGTYTLTKTVNFYLKNISTHGTLILVEAENFLLWQCITKGDIVLKPRMKLKFEAFHSQTFEFMSEV
jgi:hypothetical protein